MPGIVGIIGKGSSDRNRTVLDLMAQSMVHERFHKCGTYVNEELGVWVGWACLEDAFGHGRPIWNERHDVCLIFAGEEFRDRAQIEQLRARGHEFSPEGASYLVHLYEELGPTFLQELNGWFSGLIIDLREMTVSLFNDRYGFHRVYYSEDQGSCYFASEAKALLRALPGRRELDWTSLGEFFSCGCVLSNRSLFAGIRLVPSSARWIWSGSQPVRRETYFHADTWEQQKCLTGTQYYQQLKETFVRVLPRYLQGTDRVGISLTGGIDSRLIMACADAPPGKLPCYTFGSLYRDNTDVRAARKVAEVCGQTHRVICLDRGFIAEFPSLAEKTVYLTDGTMDVSGAADLFVNRVARSISPVRLTGNYGGEILRRMVAFRPGRLDHHIYDPGFASFVRAAAGTYEKEREGEQLSFIAFKQVPWHHYSRCFLEQSQVRLRSPYLDNEIVSLSYQAPRELAASNQPALQLIGETNPALARIGTDRGLVARPVPLVTDLLHAYQECTFKAEYLYDYGMPHWLSKVDQLCAKLHFERIFLGRHKFHHFRLWYRTGLATYLKEILLDRRALARPYLNGSWVKEIVNRHTNGTHNYTMEIHRVLTVELLQRQLLDVK